jgi:hypothetical protein
MSIIWLLLAVAVAVMTVLVVVVQVVCVARLTKLVVQEVYQPL